ncbi:MAG: hypothetical protein NTV54_11420 [Ignavibacteriales bacterium]|nr:hypothetical protein [Ignavibacteriales bacterium]
MKEEERILEEVEKTLCALDDLPTIEANPFLFTRIQARLASEDVSRKTSLAGFIELKPIALAVIIVLNIITAVYFFNSRSSEYSKDQLIHSLSAEYNSTQNDF